MALTPRDALALGGAALAAVAGAVAAFLLVTQPAGGTAGSAGDLAEPSLLPFASDLAVVPGATAPAELLVDVEGAVARPGLVRLPPGSRVADAIAAAGGYTKETDLLAAVAQINLAATLSDGSQVFVPIRGVAGGSGSDSGGASGTGDGGLVNLNTATPEELEALPGIGPVTVEKILAERQERPFATLEELVEREVMHSGQLEDIRDLVTL
jgi:competence protein ComEA